MSRTQLKTITLSMFGKIIFDIVIKYFCRINVAGMGIGDGWMSPFHNAQYGNFLYQVGLVDEKLRDQCLDMEAETQSLIEQGNLYDLEYNHLSFISRL